VYHAGTGELVHALPTPGGDIRALAFSPDAKLLSAAGHGDRIRVWSTANGEPLYDLVGHRLRTSALAYSLDGSRLASGGDQRFVWIWDTATGKPVAVLPPRPGKILSLAYCGPNHLAVGSSDNLVRVWDVAERKEVARLVGHTGSVSTLAWDASSGALISGSFDTTARIWQLKLSGASVVSHR
jgi:WD40 repeat protein